MWPFSNIMRKIREAFPVKEEPKEDPLDEIEELFEKIKERGMLSSQFQEQKEIIISNLIVAYYLNKLERKIK